MGTQDTKLAGELRPWMWAAREQVPGQHWLTVSLPQTCGQRATSEPSHAKRDKPHGHTGRQSPAVTLEHRAQVPGRSPPDGETRREQHTTPTGSIQTSLFLTRSSDRKPWIGSCGQRKTTLDLSTSRADTQPDTCQTHYRQDKGARRTGAASLRPIGKAACRGQLRVHRAGSLAPERSPAVSPAPGFTLLWWVRG